MNRDFALKLIQKTKEDYNKIADHFSQTRGYSWTEFDLIKEYFQKNDKILDIGCGNGRLFEFLKTLGIPDTHSGSFQNLNYTGVDSSENLIKAAKRNHTQGKFLIGDFLNLPLEDNSFDTVVSIAAFHHIPSEELRLEALREIKRVLKDGGKFILTVWNLWEQKKYRQYIKKEGYSSSEMRSSHSSNNINSNSNYDIGDSLIPWKFSDGKVGTLAAERYYHAFTQEETEQLFKTAGFKILKSEKTKFNFLFVLEK